MKRIAALIAIFAALMSVFIVQAAEPLTVVVDATYAYRDVLVDEDFLVISYYRAIPSSQDMQDDFAGVVVDAGGDATYMDITNRHKYDTITVIFEGVSIDTVNVAINDVDVTDYCHLASNRAQVQCESIPGGTLGAGTYTATIEYVSGWSSYSGSDILYQLYDHTPTLHTQNVTPSTGYALAAIYVGAGHGITWADADIKVTLLPSPTLWDSIIEQDATPAFCAGCATTDATATQMIADMRELLRVLEADDPSISTGEYVTDDGITEVGRVVLERAWLPLDNVLAAGFADRTDNPFEAVTPGATSWVATKVAEGTGETVAGVPAKLAPGLGSDTMGGLIFAALGLLAGGTILVVTQRRTGVASWPLALGSTWFVFSFGALINWIPWMWAGFAAIFLIAPALIFAVRRWVFAD